MRQLVLVVVFALVACAMAAAPVDLNGQPLPRVVRQTTEAPKAQAQPPATQPFVYQPNAFAYGAQPGAVAAPQLQAQMAPKDSMVGPDGITYKLDAQGYPIIPVPRDAISQAVMEDMRKERLEALQKKPAAKAEEPAPEAALPKLTAVEEALISHLTRKLAPIQTTPTTGPSLLEMEVTYRQAPSTAGLSDADIVQAAKDRAAEEAAKLQDAKDAAEQKADEAAAAKDKAILDAPFVPDTPPAPVTPVESGPKLIKPVIDEKIVPLPDLPEPPKPTLDHLAPCPANSTVDPSLLAIESNTETEVEAEVDAEADEPLSDAELAQAAKDKADEEADKIQDAKDAAEQKADEAAAAKDRIILATPDIPPTPVTPAPAPAPAVPAAPTGPKLVKPTIIDGTVGLPEPPRRRFRKHARACAKPVPVAVAVQPTQPVQYVRATTFPNVVMVPSTQQTHVVTASASTTVTFVKPIILLEETPSAAGLSDADIAQAAKDKAAEEAAKAQDAKDAAEQKADEAAAAKDKAILDAPFVPDTPPPPPPAPVTPVESGPKLIKPVIDEKIVPLPDLPEPPKPTLDHLAPCPANSTVDASLLEVSAFGDVLTAEELRQEALDNAAAKADAAAEAKDRAEARTDALKAKEDQKLLDQPIQPKPAPPTAPIPAAAPAAPAAPALKRPVILAGTVAAPEPKAPALPPHVPCRRRLRKLVPAKPKKVPVEVITHQVVEEIVPVDVVVHVPAPQYIEHAYYTNTGRSQPILMETGSSTSTEMETEVDLSSVLEAQVDASASIAAHTAAELDAEMEADMELAGEGEGEGEAEADAAAEGETEGEEAAAAEAEGETAAEGEAEGEAEADTEADTEAEDGGALTADSDPKLIFARRRHIRAAAPEPDRGLAPAEHPIAKHFIDQHAVANNGQWATENKIENEGGVLHGYHNPKVEANNWAYWKSD